jgi:hypothetical protein
VEGKAEWETLGGDVEVAGVDLADAGVGSEGGEDVAEGGSTDSAGFTEGGEGEGSVGISEGAEDPLVDREGRWGRCRGAGPLEEFEGKRGALGAQLEGDGGGGGGGALLDGEGEQLSGTAEVEVGVTPGVKLGGAAEGLTGSCLGSALAGMVDEDDGELEAALELAEVGKKRGDLARDVLVDAMEADEGVEDEEARPEGGHRLSETLPVELEIKAEAGSCNDVDVEVGQVDARGAGDAVKPSADGVQGVLGGEEEDSSWMWHLETPQTGRSGGDGDGHVEGEEGLTALGLSSDDADGFIGPQSVDEPAVLIWAGGEEVGELDRQTHRRRPCGALGFPAEGGTAKTSKYSFSSSCRTSRCAPTASSSPAIVINVR